MSANQRREVGMRGVSKQKQSLGGHNESSSFHSAFLIERFKAKCLLAFYMEAARLQVVAHSWSH